MLDEFQIITISTTVDPENMQNSVISPLRFNFSLISHLHVWNVSRIGVLWDALRAHEELEL